MLRSSTRFIVLYVARSSKRHSLYSYWLYSLWHSANMKMAPDINKTVVNSKLFPRHNAASDGEKL